MNADPNTPEKPPTPERLAAYADGELSPTEAQATEAWLRDHPDAAAEVQSLRQLAGLWQEHTAPEPAPDAWDRTLRAVENRLAVAAKPRRAPRAVLIGTGLAAACLVALLLARLFWPAPAPVIPVPPDSDEEPYAVARPDEIVIVTMDPHNAPNLVVGRPPIGDELELAGINDITLVDAQANSDGQVPQMHYGNVPIILPTESWGGKED